MKSRVMLVFVMACVAAGFFLLIKFGFLLHRDPLPPLFASGTLTFLAASVLIAGTLIGLIEGVHATRSAATRIRVREQAYQNASAATQERYRRAAELAADPTRAQYASLVERGETWTDAHITYYENTALTATCSHLQPIEQAIRSARIDVRLFRDQQVIAHCHVDLPSLKQLLALPASVRYVEYFAGDPEFHERPTAFLICEDHKSMIHTVHPENHAPWFPISSID